MENNNHTNNDKLEGNEISLTQESSSAKKLGNIWYHHKWTIIIVAFFLAVLIIVGVQLITRVKHDVNVTICGPDFFNGENVHYISNDLSNKLGEDINNDGKKAVSIITYSVFSESELHDVNTSKKDDYGNYIKLYEQSENLAQWNQYLQHSQTSDSYIFIVSKYAYEPLKNANPSRLVSISEIYGSNLPDGTLADGYGIKISDTAIYNESPAFQKLGDDYILCICKLPEMASKKQVKIYEATIEYFKNLVG